MEKETVDIWESVVLAELEKRFKDEKPMNTTLNTTLNVLATGLVALGVTSIEHSLLAGAVEVVLGIVCYIVYETIPAKS